MILRWCLTRGLPIFLEREKGFEPSTSTLASDADTVRAEFRTIPVNVFEWLSPSSRTIARSARQARAARATPHVGGRQGRRTAHGVSRRPPSDGRGPEPAARDVLARHPAVGREVGRARSSTRSRWHRRTFVALQTPIHVGGHLGRRVAEGSRRAMTRPIPVASRRGARVRCAGRRPTARVLPE